MNTLAIQSLSSRPPRRLGRRLASATLLLATGLLLALATGCRKGPELAIADVPVGTPPELGEAFPYTRFLDGHGDVVDLDEVRRDTRVLLVFMRGFDGLVCPYCTRQTAELITRQAELREQGLAVYIVYPGAESTIPLFVEEVGEKAPLQDGELPMPLLLDVDLRAVRTIGIPANLAKPATFVIDRDGSVIYRYIGERRNDRPTIDAVLEGIAGTTPVVADATADSQEPTPDG